MKHIDLVNNDKELQNKIALFIDEYFTSQDIKFLNESKFNIKNCGFSGTWCSNCYGLFVGDAIYIKPLFKKTTCNNLIAHELTHLLCSLRHDVTNNDSYRKNSAYYTGHGESFFRIGNEIFGKDYMIWEKSDDYEYISLEIKNALKDEWWARFNWIFNEVNDIYKHGGFTKTEMIELTDIVINTLVDNDRLEQAETLLS